MKLVFVFIIFIYKDLYIISIYIIIQILVRIKNVYIELYF